MTRQMRKHNTLLSCRVRLYVSVTQAVTQFVFRVWKRHKTRLVQIRYHVVYQVKVHTLFKQANKFAVPCLQCKRGLIITTATQILIQASSLDALFPYLTSRPRSKAANPAESRRSRFIESVPSSRAHYVYTGNYCVHVTEQKTSHFSLSAASGYFLSFWYN